MSSAAWEDTLAGGEDAEASRRSSERAVAEGAEMPLLTRRSRAVVAARLLRRLLPPLAASATATLRAGGI